MKVTFHWRDNEISATSYEMELVEFKRLASDYARYMQEGFPSEGIYLCRNRPKITGAMYIEKLHIKFSEIAVIT